MHLIRGCGLGDAKDAAQREDLLARAREIARKVLAGKPSDLDIPPYYPLAQAQPK